MIWGVIEPEGMASSRLRLDFGLGRAIRKFNEICFPGVSSVFFVRQLTWSVIGLDLAEKIERRHSPMRVAEAVEALACFIALHRSGNPSPYENSKRVQGKRKLDNAKGFSFQRLSKKSNYVTSPFRIGSTAALIGLGLAEGPARRFNSMTLTAKGILLAELVLSKRTETIDETAGDWLRSKWIRGKNEPKRIPDIISSILLPGVYEKDPKGATTEERNLIRRQLCEGNDAQTRKIMMDAMKQLKSPPGTRESNNRLRDLVKGTSQHSKLIAAFAFEAMRSSALDIVQYIATMVRTNSVKLITLSQDEKLQHLYEELEQKCNDLINKMKTANMQQLEAEKFCVEQGNGAVVKRLTALITRLPKIFVINEAMVQKDYLFREDLVLDDEEGALPENGEDKAGYEPTPRRLWSAYQLMQDCSHGK